MRIGSDWVAHNNNALGMRDQQVTFAPPKNLRYQTYAHNIPEVVRDIYQFTFFFLKINDRPPVRESHHTRDLGAKDEL